MKYGKKALRMLKMSGGFDLGEGIGKDNQGILNPVEAVQQTDKGGIGFQSGSVARVADKKEINMDIHDKEGEQIREEQIQQ